MATSYRHDIAAWMDGTESLSHIEYRAYHVVCELIYLQEGPIVANEKGLAGRCNMHVLQFRIALESLVKLGKLAIVDGKITNRRASVEIAQGLRRRTPRRPPANPPATPAQPPPGSPRKSLRLKMPVEHRGDDTKTGGVSSSLPSLPFGDSRLDVDSEERSTRRGGALFDEFWRQYPHKVGKAAARKAFERVAKKRVVTFETMMLGLMRYAAKTDDRPWCNPATWLNQERWLDEPATNGGQNVKREGSVLDAFERISGALERGEDDPLRENPVRSLPAR